MVRALRVAEAARIEAEQNSKLLRESAQLLAYLRYELGVFIGMRAAQEALLADTLKVKATVDALHSRPLFPFHQHHPAPEEEQAVPEVA